MTFTYKTSDGKFYSASSRDADRARIAAKRAALSAGSSWTGAKLVKIGNAL